MEDDGAGLGRMMAASLVGEAGGLTVLLTPAQGRWWGRRGVGVEAVGVGGVGWSVWRRGGEEAAARGEVEQRRRRGARWRRGGGEGEVELGEDGGEDEVERRRAARIWAAGEGARLSAAEREVERRRGGGGGDFGGGGMGRRTAASVGGGGEEAAAWGEEGILAAAEAGGGDFGGGGGGRFWQLGGVRFWFARDLETSGRPALPWPTSRTGDLSRLHGIIDYLVRATSVARMGIKKSIFLKKIIICMGLYIFAIAQ